MRSIVIFIASAAVFGVASPAAAQMAASPSPLSPTEQLHRGTSSNPLTRFSAQRWGRSAADESFRRMLFNEESIIQRAMVTPSLDADAYRYAKEMSDCLLKSMGEEAEAILGRVTTGADGSVLIEATDIDLRTACIMHRGHLVARPTLEAAMAETLIVRDVGRFEDRAMMVDVNEADEFSGLVPGAAPDFAMIGRCVAVYSPGLVQAVLDTEPGSREERAAIDTLYAATPECGLSQAPGKVSPSYQRGVFAMGLYRWWQRGRDG